MTNAFAIIHTWPDLRNAEYEVLQRLLMASQRVGVSAVVIDDNAKVLWASPELALTEGSQLPDDSVEFVLSLHFLSPRVVDVYSYITLWQPIDFYHQFGYQKSIDCVTSHNDLISCDSDLADHHGMNLFVGVGRAPIEPLPKMFHMLPEPFLAPKISKDSRLFYIGINWERLGREKGRFHDTLVTLDRKGLIDIYGPEQVHGTPVWDGFSAYRGEIPFDGVSIKNAINQSGICLALSSASHKHAGIMSNRLFEGLAGGAAIIATPNPIIDKYFKSVVYHVDDTRGEAILGQQIIEAMRMIHADPAEATRRATEGQRILREFCSLEDSIRTLFADNKARIAHHEANFLAEAEISVVIVYKGENISQLGKYLRQFERQKKVSVHLFIICSEQFAERHRLDTSQLCANSIRSVSLYPINLDPSSVVFDGPRATRDRTGPTILKILAAVKTSYFAFACMDEVVFTDHYATVVKAIIDTPTSMAGCSGMIIKSLGADRVEKRTFHSARFVELDSIVLVHGLNQVGRFVFRSDLLSARCQHLIPLLDGEEHSYFRLSALLAGPLAQSNYATYMLDESAANEVGRPVEPLEHQRQYIRDYFARDPRWLDRLGKRTSIPEFVYAYSPGSPIRWDSYSAPRSITQQIALNQILTTQVDGPGLHYIVGGFSWPEPDRVWMEAERGVIEFALPDSDLSHYEDITVCLTVSGRRSLGTGRHQHCTFAINGMVVAYDKIPDEVSDVCLKVPLHLSSASRIFRLELTPDHAEPVYDHTNKVVDSRRLSMNLRAITVLSDLQDAPPVFVTDKIYRFATGEEGIEALGSNFYSPEAEMTWIAGSSGLLRFRIKQSTGSWNLKLTMIGRSSLESGSPQTAMIEINGFEFGPFEIGIFPQTIIVPFELLSNITNFVTVKAAHAEAVFDENHAIIDNRLLGIAIYGMEIVESTSE